MKINTVFIDMQMRLFIDLKRLTVAQSAIAIYPSYPNDKLWYSMYSCRQEGKHPLFFCAILICSNQSAVLIYPFHPHNNFLVVHAI